MSELLNAALKYAELGYHVIPLFGIVEGKCECGKADCVSPGKHPRIQDWQHKASSEDAVVRRWWGMWEQSNIGILLNPDLVVLDIDRHGDTDGYESFRKAEELHGPIPETVSATTGGGGLHFYFRGNCRTHKYKSLPGVDVKGQDSFTILPPSLHVSGKRYEWAPDASLLELEVADAPKWLLKPDRVQSAAQRNGETLTTWGEGERNVNLLRHAGVLRRYGHTPQRILSFLTELNAENCSPPLDQSEVAYIAKSVSRYEPDPVASRTVTTEQETDDGLWWLTDGGNAKRFVKGAGKDFLHVRTLPDGWMHFSGGRWRHDPKAATRAAQSIASEIVAEADRCQDSKKADQLLAWAKKSNMVRGVRDMLALASADSEIEAEIEQFDAAKHIICTPSGAVDLKTGELRDAERTDFFTKCTGAPYDPKCDTTIWEKFILEIMDGDKEMAEYLRRLAGYSLTADTSAQAFFVLYGAGLNGKNTLTDTLVKAWGSYHKTTTPETWLVNYQRNKDLDMAMLVGARLTIASEFKENRAMDESIVKTVTGDGTIYARNHHAQGFDYEPSVKLWMATNHKPDVGSGSFGFWRRVRLIPFECKFSVDNDFKGRMMAQAPAALTWAVQGAQEWLQGKGELGDPKKVIDACNAYREESDELGRWIEACCIVDPMEIELFGDMYESYVDWCHANRDKPASKTAIGKKLGDKGFESVRGAKGVAQRKGLRLRGSLDD